MLVPLALKKLLVRTGAARFLSAAKRLPGGSTDFLHYYSDRVLAAPRDVLLDAAAFPDDLLPADVLDLNLAAPRFESPVSGGRIAADRIGRPPAWGLPGLRQAITANYQQRDGRRLDPSSEVLITHGATGAYAAVLDAFVNPGNTVVLFDPGSPLFATGAISRRARLRRVPAGCDGGRVRFDPDTLSKALRGATLLALADPVNPTGAVFAPEDLERIAWAANRSDVLIYLDESFARFRYDGRWSPLATMPDVVNRTLSAGSVTQADGLGSVRVGWLTGHRHLVGACALTASLAAPFVPTVCQQVALRAVQADEELFGPVLEEFRARRRYTADRLATMGFTVESPAAGYFFWVSVGSLELDGRTFAERLLQEQRVLVGPGDVFGATGAGHIRVSFATEDGRLREALGRLATFVAGLRGEPVVKSAAIPSPTDAVVESPQPAFSRV